ncbi:MAG: hypothetical protein WBB82_01050, partial [Limnothrix sp.]
TKSVFGQVGGHGDGEMNSKRCRNVKHKRIVKSLLRGLAQFEGGDLRCVLGFLSSEIGRRAKATVKIESYCSITGWDRVL